MTIDERFTHTTLDIQAISRYICPNPARLILSIQIGADIPMRKICCRADFVEFHLREYITGEAKTLHGLLRNVRAFIAVDKYEAYILTSYMLRENKKMLLANEWYEFMPRLTYARRRVTDLFLV